MAALVTNALLVRTTVAAFEPTQEQLDRLAARRRASNKVLAPALVMMGVGFGLIAGRIPSYWPDLFFGLLMLLTALIVPLTFLQRAKRRFAAQLQSARVSD